VGVAAPRRAEYSSPITATRVAVQESPRTRRGAGLRHPTWAARHLRVVEARRAGGSPDNQRAAVLITSNAAAPVATCQRADRHPGTTRGKYPPHRARRKVKKNSLLTRMVATFQGSEAIGERAGVRGGSGPLLCAGP